MMIGRSRTCCIVGEQAVLISLSTPTNFLSFSLPITNTCSLSQSDYSTWHEKGGEKVWWDNWIKERKISTRSDRQELWQLLVNLFSMESQHFSLSLFLLILSFFSFSFTNSLYSLFLSLSMNRCRSAFKSMNDPAICNELVSLFALWMEQNLATY